MWITGQRARDRRCSRPTFCGGSSAWPWPAARTMTVAVAACARRTELDPCSCCCAYQAASESTLVADSARTVPGLAARYWSYVCVLGETRKMRYCTCTVRVFRSNTSAWRVSFSCRRAWCRTCDARGCKSVGIKYRDVVNACELTQYNCIQCISGIKETETWDSLAVFLRFLKRFTPGASGLLSPKMPKMD